MKIASIADVKANFSSYVRESEKGAVVVTRNGRPVAVLLGVRDDDEVERLILSHSRKLRDILDAARAADPEPEKASATKTSGSKLNAKYAEPREPEKAPTKPRGRKPRKS